MEAKLNPRIEKKLKENADNEILYKFLVRLLREEFLNSDKASWRYTKFYRQKVIEYAPKYFAGGKTNDD